MFVGLSIQVTYLREDVHVPTMSHSPHLYASFRATLLHANQCTAHQIEQASHKPMLMSREDMQPEPQLQFCDTSLLASDEEPSQLQPLQSILKEPKYTKSITFSESLSKPPKEQTTNYKSTPPQQDIPKTPKDKD